MAPCTHPGMKRLFRLKAKNGLMMKRLFLYRQKTVSVASLPQPCLITNSGKPTSYLQKAMCVRGKKNKIPLHPKHTRLKMYFLVLEPQYGPASRYEHQSRYVGHGDCATHRAVTHPPSGVKGVRIHDSTSRLRVSAGVLCLARNGGALEA